MKRRNWVLLAMFLLLWTGSASCQGNERFDSLAERYSRKIEARGASMELRRNLLNEAEDLAPYELWQSLFRPEIAPRQGAANALALLESLLEQGDPASWDKVSGLFHPSLVSKPLAAADGIFMAVAFLLEMEDKGSGEAAVYLLERFQDSSRGKYYFLTTCPGEYLSMVKEMSSRDLLPSYGQWTEGKPEGKLPLASPVIWSIGQDTARTLGMTFLDSAGRPGINGVFAWDRERGRIYYVVEGGRSLFFPLD